MLTVLQCKQHSGIMKNYPTHIDKSVSVEAILALFRWSLQNIPVLTCFKQPI